MKVLALPKDRNPYQELLYGPLASTGVRLTYLLDGPTRSQTLNLLLLPLVLVFRRLGGYSIVHLHWVFGFQLPWAGNSVAARRVMQAWFALNLKAIKRLGFKLVWTAHNLYPHEPVFADDVSARRLLARQSDAVIAHSLQTGQRLEAVGVMNPTVIPQGPYPVAGGRQDPAASRARLGLDPAEFVVLFIGRVAPYKGVDQLLASVESIPDEVRLRVLVAGECPDPTVRGELLRLAAREARVTVRLEWIPHNELAVYLAAADFAVFPFRRVTNSASVMLALSSGVPVIIPDLPDLDEVPSSASVRYPAGTAGLCQALQNAAALPPEDRRAMGEAAYNFASTRSWENAAAQTKQVFEAVLTGGSRSSARIGVGSAP